MSTVAGGRFSQTQPVQAFAVADKLASLGPWTLLTVPAGQTWHLKSVHVTIAAVTLMSYTGGPNGQSAQIMDSLGNIYLTVQLAYNQPNQAFAIANQTPTFDAVLPAGTVVSLASSGLIAGVLASVGGGAIWSPS